MNKNKAFGTFIGVSSFEALAMFRRGLFYSYLSIYLKFFLGLSVTETTLFSTLPMILNVLFQTFVWGKLSDKFQLRRTLIICGEILAGIGTFFIWYGHRIPEDKYLAGYVIIIGLSIVECFWSMSNVGWSALISDIYAPEKRNAIQGKLTGVGGVGRMIGVWIGGLLYDGLGLRYDGWGFYEGGLFFIATLVMFLSVIPMCFVQEGGIGKNSGASNSQGLAENQSEKIFWLFLSAMIFINFGRNSIAIMKSQYLVLDSGFAVSNTLLSNIVNTHSVAMIATGFTVGLLGKKFGIYRTLWLATLVAMISLFIFGMATNIEMIFLSNLLSGASDVVINATSYTIASLLIPPEKRAKKFGVYNSTFFLSWGLSATLIAGPMIDFLIKSGKTMVFAYKMAFLTSCGITGIGLIILFIFIKKTSLKKAV